jgi:hypothetical protein
MIAALALSLAIQLGSPCEDESVLMPELERQGFHLLAQGIYPGGRFIIVHNKTTGGWAIFGEYESLAGTLCLLVEGDKLALREAQRPEGRGHGR